MEACQLSGRGVPPEPFLRILRYVFLNFYSSWMAFNSLRSGVMLIDWSVPSDLQYPSFPSLLHPLSFLRLDIYRHVRSAMQLLPHRRMNARGALAGIAEPDWGEGDRGGGGWQSDGQISCCQLRHLRPCRDFEARDLRLGKCNWRMLMRRWGR